MLRVLFVCTGNTCRSPMAEAIFYEKVRLSGMNDRIRVLSAGVAAQEVFPASKGAQNAMMRRGLSLAEHRSRLLLPEFVRAADLILTMSQRHKESTIALVPQAEGKVYTLKEFAGETGDIDDPWMGSDATYEACSAEISRLIELAWDRVIALADAQDDAMDEQEAE